MPRSSLPLSAYVLKPIVVGLHGYGVLVDDAKKEARVYRSSRSGTETRATFPYGSDKRRAIADATLTAFDLDETAEAIARMGAGAGFGDAA